MKAGKTIISPSAILVLLIIVIIVVVYFLRPYTNVLCYDVFGYYLYLPSLFIHHDYALRDQSWVHHIVETYHSTSPIYQYSVLENGNSVMGFSMGLAILYAPAFLIAHAYTLLTGGNADGFSAPYQLSMIIFAQLVTLIGLWFSRKVLLNYFTEWISCIVLILLVFGTNYFHTAVYGGNMPHNTLFSLLALMIWALIRWEQTKKMLFVIIIGLAGGLITLIRPTEIVVFLIPILWGVIGVKSLKNRLILLGGHWRQLIVCLVMIVLAGLPQMIYWKLITGSFLHYSYVGGVGLFFDSPHLAEVLVGFRKGWMIYTPLMVFSIMGFVAVWLKQRPLFLPLLVYVMVNIYLVSCWSCWWYAGGDFSQRALVSSYAVLILPLGFLVDRIKKAWQRILLAFVFLFLISLNLFQTWQFHHGIISGERMTKAYYCKVFGKATINEEDLKLLLIDRSLLQGEISMDEASYEKSQMLYLNFDTVAEKDPECYLSDTSFQGRFSFAMDLDHQFSPGAALSYSDMVNGEYAIVRASVYVYIPVGYNEDLPLLCSNFLHGNTSFFYFDRTINKDSIQYNSWNYIETTFLTPEVVSPSDKLFIHVWHRGKARILIDQLRVDVFRPKPGK